MTTNQLLQLAIDFKYQGSIEGATSDVVYKIFLSAVSKAGLISGDPNLIYDLQKPQLYYCCEEINNYKELVSEIEFEKKLKKHIN